MDINKAKLSKVDSTESSAKPKTVKKDTTFIREMGRDALGSMGTYVAAKSTISTPKRVVTEKEIEDFKAQIAAVPQYNRFQEKTLIEMFKRNPDIVSEYSKLIAYPLDIDAMLKTYLNIEKNPKQLKFLERILTEKMDRHGKEAPRYDSHTIINLINLSNVDFDFAEQLADKSSFNNPVSNKVSAVYKTLQAAVGKDKVFDYINADNANEISEEIYGKYTELKKQLMGCTNIDPKKKSDAMDTLALMRTFNEDGYNKILAQTENLNLFNKGKYNLELLSDIKFNQSIDDDLIQKLNEAKKQEALTRIDTDDTFKDFDKETLKTVLSYFEDGVVQNQILTDIAGSKDKNLMKEFIEKNLVNTLKYYDSIKDSPKVNRAAIERFLPTITQIIKQVSSEPEKVKKVQFLLDIKNPFQLQEILKKTISINVPDESIKEVLDVHQKNKSVRGEKFNPLDVKIDMDILDGANGDLSSFAEYKRKHLNYPTIFKMGLLELSVKDDEKFNRIKGTGVCDMVMMGTLPNRIFSNLNENSDFSPEMYEDLDAVKNDRSIVKEYPAETSVEDAFSETKTGDVVEIGDKMYINDGESLFEWKMTKDKYLELFPPVLRFSTKQQALGDCFFVAALTNSMMNPIARANLYKSFEQNGNDVTVTINGYGGFGGSYTFVDSKFDFDSQRKHIFGAKGLQMYEQLYKLCSLRENLVDTTPLEDPTGMEPNVLAERIQGGRSDLVYTEIHGLENAGLSDLDSVLYSSNVTEVQNKDVLYDVPDDIKHASGRIVRLIPQKIENCLEKYGNREDICLGFGTIPKPKSAAESALLPEYNLLSSHAYSIRGYNPTTKTVTINNPHNSCVNIEIPLDKLSKYMSTMYLTALK